MIPDQGLGEPSVMLVRATPMTVTQTSTTVNTSGGVQVVPDVHAGLNTILKR